MHVSQSVPPLRRIQGRHEERPRADGPRVDGRVLGRQQLAVGLGAVHPSPQLHLAATDESQRTSCAIILYLIGQRSIIQYRAGARACANWERGHMAGHVERKNRRGL